MVLCSGEIGCPHPSPRTWESYCQFEKKRILVLTDFSECSRYALEWAMGFARRFGCDVLVLDVEDRRTLASASQFDELRQEVMREINNEFDSFLADVTTQGVQVERIVETTLGDPTDEIVRLACEADLIVIPAECRRGLRQTLLESIAERVIRRAPCPVLSVKRPSG